MIKSKELIAVLFAIILLPALLQAWRFLPLQICDKHGEYKSKVAFPTGITPSFPRAVLGLSDVEWGKECPRCYKSKMQIQ